MKVIYILTNYVQIVWEKNVYEYKTYMYENGYFNLPKITVRAQKHFFMEDSQTSLDSNHCIRAKSG